MQHHPDFFMAHCSAAYLPTVQQLIQPTGNDSDRQLAGQLAANFCEHLGERCVSQWSTYIPQLLEDMHDKKSDVRGTACYGVSMAARLPAFAPHAVTAAQRGAQVVTEARSRSKKKSDQEAQCAADNALSVLLEVLENHPQAAATQGNLWSTWLSGLPCQEDTEEGSRNNKALLRLAQQQTPGLVGDGGRNIPRVIELLVNAYSTDFVDVETSKAIPQFLLALGEGQLQQLSSSFTPKLTKKLMRVAREAQKAT